MYRKLNDVALLLVVGLSALIIIAPGSVPLSSARSVISFDTSTSWVGQGNSVTLTITPMTTNELLLVGSAYNPNYGGLVPIAPGLTFKLLRHVDSYVGSIGINVNYAILPNAGQQYSVTVAYKNGVMNNLGVILAAFAGANNLSPVAQNVAGKGQNSVPSLSVTPLNSVDLIWGFIGSSTPTTQTAGQGFTLDRQRLYFGSPADEYGFSSSSVSFGTPVSGAWTLIGVEIQAPMATGQNVPVNVAPSTTASAGSTLTVSANTAGLLFNTPTYAWSAAGCPDFVNPGSVSSFSYVSRASGIATNCVFSVSVSDFAGDTGSGQSATVTINPATGQTVPVMVSPGTTVPAGSTLTVSANAGGLVFSSPAYAWTATGCPNFSSPGSVQSFSYVSTSSGTTNNCVFSVSVSDSYGNTGSGNSPTVTIVTGQSSVKLDTSQVVFGQFGTKVIQITTKQTNELILVGIGFNSNYQIGTPTAPGLIFTPLTASPKSGGASLGSQAFYALAGTAHTYNITVGYANGGFNNIGIIAAAFSGVKPSTLFDGPFAWGTGGPASSIPTVTVSPSLPGDAIWAFQVNENCVAQTPESGYKIDQAIGCYESPADEYSTSIVTGTQSVTFGKSVQYWVMFAVAIQDPPVAPTSPVGGVESPPTTGATFGSPVPAQVFAKHLIELLIVRSEVFN